MSGASLVLDTHALLWWLADGSRLPKRLRSQLDRASLLAVSTISVWEIGMLVEKGRLELDRDLETWANDLDAMPEIELVVVNHRIAACAALLDDFHGDPADRLIVATALELRAPLVTKDDRIIGWSKRTGLVDTRW